MFRYYSLIFMLSLFSTTHAQSASKASPVYVTEVKKSSFVNVVEAIGTLRATDSVDLMATVTDRVVRVAFDDGQRVKKGQVLVELDDAAERADLAEEQARLNEALKQIERLEPLAKRNAATQSTLDEELREVEIARARIKGIQSRITERKILAPFNGVLGLRRISIGAIAQPGLVLTTVDDDSRMKIDFSVPEIFLDAIAPGIAIEAKTKAFPNKVFKGEVVSLDSRIDPVTRSIIVRAYIDNTDYQLRPGLLMRVGLQARPRQAVVIPEEALISTATKHSVYKVVQQDKQTSVSLVNVEIGERRTGELEILSGLEAGDSVVIHGLNRIKPGQAIEVKAIENDNETVQQLLQQRAGSN